MATSEIIVTQKEFRWQGENKPALLKAAEAIVLGLPKSYWMTANGWVIGTCMTKLMFGATIPLSLIALPMVLPFAFAGVFVVTLVLSILYKIIYHGCLAALMAVLVAARIAAIRVKQGAFNLFDLVRKPFTKSVAGS